MSPFLKLIALSLNACLLSTAIAAAATYVIPQTKALDSSGHRTYVDDATLKATIPDLAGAGERSGTCSNSMMTPPYLFLEFGPTVTGAHVGRVANVTCAFESKQSRIDGDGQLSCNQVRFESVGFDDDVSHFFRADASVEPAEARELFHAFFAGQLPFEDSVMKQDVAKVREVSISKDGGSLVVRWGGCGCWFTLQVAHQEGDPRKPFVVTNHSWHCV